ncbi:hypothetical protein PRIPAC_81747 [Pristionchus pacificus]|nr:hypothetical protein PRIPAC_81747 [Pristionchus pacificus]
MANSTITFFVNGNEVRVQNPDPELTLSTFLRYKLNLTGTKLGCEEGTCGACTVAIARWNALEKRARFVSANACIVPLYLVDGALVLTVEGIGSQKRLHPIQERLSSGNATQCGFCSPGFVMAAYALLRNNPTPTADEIRAALVGNLCRCTGYRPILEALESFANPSGGCCMGGQGGCPCKESTKENSVPDKEPLLICGLVNYEQMRKFDESSEIIFPPKLIMQHRQQSFVLKGKRVTLYRPTSLEALSATFKSLVTVDRFVSTGIKMRLDHSMNPSPTANAVWLSIQHIHELKNVVVSDGIIHIGSGLTISEFVVAIRAHCKSEQYVSTIDELFAKYSSDQVKNTVKLGIAAFKHGKRLGADDSVLNAAASYDEATGSCRIVVGAFQRPLILDKSSACASFLIAKWAQKYIPVIELKKLRLRNGECPSDSIASAIDADFEQFSVENEFDYKKRIAKAALTDMLSVLAGTVQEGGLSITRNALEPLQLFKGSDPSISPVGRPLRHAAADRHTTGEAEYVDDIRIHELKHAALVLSTEAHARIISIDPSSALAVEGVLAYVDAKDIPPGGKLRPSLSPLLMVQDDTPVFADGVVEMIGQPIGCIVADDVETARRAAQLVNVEYEKLPAILTMEDAIVAQSYLLPKPMQFGKSQEEVDKALKAAPILLEGELEIGGQEHLCMETQSSIVVPQENDEWTLYTSTQNPSDAQYLCANLLGIPVCNIVVKVKRLGGGFGGKATGDHIARAPAIVAANKLRKPVSCVLHRYDDMITTGKRHPALFKYRVGIDDDGRLLTVHVVQYIQAGYSMDHSVLIAIMIQYADACYRVPAMRAECWALKTHTCSNTGFRGFGRPQTFFFMETVMAEVAQRVGKTLNEVKKLNLFNEGDRALCGSTIRNYCLPKCWQELERFSDFDKLYKECEEFNKTSRRIKRGVAISGTVQGLTSHWFEMGNAHVQIMLDGTVRVNVGHVEMGQGLNTKMIQIAAAVFKIPHEKINVIEMATDKTANAFPTASSIGTDKACEKLLEGIQPHIDQHEGDFVKALMSAWIAKVPLQANETVKVEREAHNMPPRELTYFTTGAACVLVEVDCATGEHKLKLVDIIMDLGDSINPAIDIGQIEGAFMQGYGLMTSEEIETDCNDQITNATVSGYKIPTVHMVPERFRVKLLENGKNYPGQIYRSKGIGEPPLLTATAVHSAIRMAIDSYRGKVDFQRLDSPLTAKRILNACQGNL